MGKYICVIGGDLRQLEAARLLQLDGYGVKVFGFENIEKPDAIQEIMHEDLKLNLLGADIVLLPLPSITEGRYINIKNSDSQLEITQVLTPLKPGTVVLGSMICEELEAEISQYNINYIDYYKREELIIANSVPSAEGTLQVAMEETSKTIRGSSCLITGYGRMGKLIAKMFGALGSNVTVVARKPSDFAWIDAMGYKGIKYSELCHAVKKSDIIINTVPVRLFTKEVLVEVKKDALIIDVASKPGGVDFDTAQHLGLRVIWALSIPGKVAPVSAGRIIKKTIDNILQERGQHIDT